MPTRFEITIFRATITLLGTRLGYPVSSLCDQAPVWGDVTLASCPRPDKPAPPRAFRPANPTPVFDLVECRFRRVQGSLNRVVVVGRLQQLVAPASRAPTASPARPAATA
jgi:hypothetical protein